MDPFVGEIRMFGASFAPRGWALCNGALLSITQNTALFSLLGTNYGGDGRSTFALPNLQGNVPIHQGQGPGLSTYSLGQTGGTATETLLTTEMPAHTHSFSADAQNAVTTLAAGNLFAKAPARAGVYYGTSANTVAMAANAVGAGGSGLPHNNLQPLLVVTFIIALQGVFPARQ